MDGLKTSQALRKIQARVFLRDRLMHPLDWHLNMPFVDESVGLVDNSDWGEAVQNNRLCTIGDYVLLRRVRHGLRECLLDLDERFRLVPCVGLVQEVREVCANVPVHIVQELVGIHGNNSEFCRHIGR